MVASAFSWRTSIVELRCRHNGQRCLAHLLPDLESSRVCGLAIMTKHINTDISGTAETAPPVRLKDQAYAVLERMIVTGELVPGRWVSESELMAISSFSRSPIRSAVERLAEQELLKVSPRRGAMVCPVDFTQQFRALELRRVVERLLVASAASRADEKQRLKFGEYVAEYEQIAETRDQNQMTRVDSDMTHLIILAADNGFAAKAMTSVKGLSRRFWILYHENHADLAVLANRYRDVAAAIAAGSSTDAEAAVNELIDYIEKFTLSVIGYSSS